MKPTRRTIGKIIHKALLGYLNEGLTEGDKSELSGFKSFGGYPAYDPSNIMSQEAQKDVWQRVEINEDYAILYNASKRSALPSVLKKGANIEYLGDSAGSYVWGRGIYTNFQLYQPWFRTIENKDLYGTVVVKFKYGGDILKEFLVAQSSLQVEPLSEQMKRFKNRQGVSLYDYLKTKTDISNVDDEANSRYSSGGLLPIKNFFGGDNMGDRLLQFGVQGVLFFGHNDRPVAVVYNVDKLEVLGYIDNTRVYNLDHSTNWTRLRKGEGGRTNNNDIRYIINYFGNFKATASIVRGRYGEVLVTDVDTGKKTFIDVLKANDSIINHQGKLDPRLFGDFEFDNAQNFEEIKGKEMAYVQLGKGKDADYFYIDKKGYFYYGDNLNRPVSSIQDYYSTVSNEDSTEIEDSSVGDLFNFENVLREDRTITQDGHVELDNFDLVRNIITKTKPMFDSLLNGRNDTPVYFLQLLERHKDHPDRKYEHNACDYITSFQLVSIDHLNAIEPVIKSLCQKGEYRAMFYLNPRLMGATIDYAKNTLASRFKKYDSHMKGHEVDVAYGQSKDWDDRPLCFVDVDSDDPDVQRQVLDYIKKMGITPLDMYNTTNNGLHIILPDKNAAKKLDFSFLDKGKSLGRWATAGVEIDKSITLYAYVIPHGYTVQQNVQNRKINKR